MEEITKTNEERWMFHVKQTVEEKGKGLENYRVQCPPNRQQGSVKLAPIFRENNIHISIPVLLLRSISKLFNLSGPEFAHLKNGDTMC